MVANAAAIFFLQAATLVGLPWLLWRLPPVRAVMPLVVVQVLVGIALGPTLFGKLWPAAWAQTFGPDRLAMLTGLQWLAVTLFCFLNGLHLRGLHAESRPGLVLAVSAGGIVVPLVLGALFGLWLADALPAIVGARSTPAGSALAIGLCAAVTALPVLAAILHEMDLRATRLGALALKCAAVTDGAIWFLLTLALLAGTAGTGMDVALTAAGVVGYLGVMLWLLRPLLARLALATGLGSHDGNGPDWLPVLALVVVAGSACLSELTGLHHVMGGLLAGLVWPPRFAATVRRQIAPLTFHVLMPFFFLSAGLRAEISLDGMAWLQVFAGSLAVSLAGKMLGVALPARLAGLGWRDAVALGALLQTKGMVELVVLGMLREAGVIGAPAFAGLLLTALATTVLAKPLTMACMRVARGGATGLRNA